MMTRWNYKLLLLAGTFLLLFSPSLKAVDRGNLRLMGFYWTPQIEGQLRITKQGNAENFLSLREDLGINGPNHPESFDDYFKRTLGFEVQMAAKDYNLNVAGYRTRYRGFSTLSENINFGDSSFSAGSVMENTLKFEMLDIEIEVNAYNSSAFYIGVLMGVKIFNYNVTLSSPSTYESETGEAVIPYLGITAIMELGQIATLYGRIVGLSSDLEQGAFSIDEFYYVSGSVGFMLHFGKLVSLGIEWRKVGLSFKASNTKESQAFRFKLGGDTEKFYMGFRLFVMLRF